ncbi:hypothetical protein CLI92_02725 [Vandammella animalimorsus]|uniref:Uncharacterized protein n=1 Tax=Vandammella animalimorsus TaxID=2029117 RepID=A0A2A2T760_9BURK|nr:hypothetical protein CK626_03485 [Vandammella animalimorsus]PAX17770.1 hypothetical protein CLI92_02725 [Vandammella animalimorsus]PAX19924.1 hypothetical protein CLI93_04150 [Vandammella animalimorsus]
MPTANVAGVAGVAGRRRCCTFALPQAGQPCKGLQYGFDGKPWAGGDGLVFSAAPLLRDMLQQTGARARGAQSA